MALTETDIRRALALPPGPVRSDFDLNPGQGPERAPRRAAVLCALRPGPAGMAVVLTRRSAHLRAHAGQIAFPGGQVEPGDPTPLAAALRESHEEIGLAPEQVALLGALEPYLTVTGFEIAPFVARVDPGWRPRPDPAEVEAVFEAPLDFLMDPANLTRGAYDRGGRRRHFYAIPWREQYVWGATAGMLKGLSDRLARLHERAP